MPGLAVILYDSVFGEPAVEHKIDQVNTGIARFI